MNRINELFQHKSKQVLSIYFTAGHPTPNSAMNIIKELDKQGVDMIEIGIPFSDPLADGPVIQQSGQKALENGMTVKKLIAELKDIRLQVKTPLLMMGYFNTILRFGVEDFCKEISQVGIDGVIFPDMPIEVYENEYKNIFEKYGVIPVFLICPSTPLERIHQTERLSKGFIYVVSSSSTTGIKKGFSDENIAYFKQVEALKLNVPTMVGFGISNKDTFLSATEHANGAIIGSAFIKALELPGSLEQNIAGFIKSIKG
jgi:tryptophan synthase alpha chain